MQAVAGEMCSFATEHGGYGGRSFLYSWVEENHAFRQYNDHGLRMYNAPLPEIEITGT